MVELMNTGGWVDETQMVQLDKSRWKISKVEWHGPVTELKL